MAQNFRQYKIASIGTTATDVPDAANFDSYDCIVGLRLCNRHTQSITVDAYLKSGDVGAKVNVAVSGSTAITVDNLSGTIVNGMQLWGPGVTLNSGAQPLVTNASNQASIVVDTAQTLGDNVDLIFSNPTDYYLVKDAPIPSGSSLELIDGGAKIVCVSGDRLYLKSNTATSLDAIVSVVDAIST